MYKRHTRFKKRHIAEKRRKISHSQVIAAMTRYDNDDGTKEAYKYAKETCANTSLLTYSNWEFTGNCGDDSARQRRWRKRGEAWLIPDVCETWRMHTCETKRFYSMCVTRHSTNQVRHMHKFKLGWSKLEMTNPLRLSREMCHDSFICVTWLIHMCDMTHAYLPQEQVQPMLQEQVQHMLQHCTTHEPQDATRTSTTHEPQEQVPPMFVVRVSLLSVRECEYVSFECEYVSLECEYVSFEFKHVFTFGLRVDLRIWQTWFVLVLHDLSVCLWRCAMTHVAQVYSRSESRDVFTLKRDVFALKRDVLTLKRDVFTLKRDLSTCSRDILSLEVCHDTSAWGPLVFGGAPLLIHMCDVTFTWLLYIIRVICTDLISG